MAVKASQKESTSPPVENAETDTGNVTAGESKFPGLVSAPQSASAAKDQPVVGEIRKQQVQLQSGKIRNIRVRITKTRSADPDEPQEKK